MQRYDDFLKSLLHKMRQYFHILRQSFVYIINNVYVPMKIDFQYSTDFYGMNAKELSDTCMHLLCTAGEGSFVFNELPYHEERPGGDTDA